MTVAILAAALIRMAEGCRYDAYQDSGGVWTIGFGHTAGVKAGDICTSLQVEAWLAEDVARLFALVENEPLIAAAAYVSFGYNCGYHALQMVLEGKDCLLDYVHDKHGNPLPGLMARRALEMALIQSAGPVTA